MYATGLTPAEIQAFAESLEWEEVLSGTPRRADMAYRRKEDDRLFPVALELGLDRRGVRLPRGLATAQSLNLMLSDFAVAVREAEDFDALPIPFRPVVVDLETGEALALLGGDLAQAIRASMSIPGVFVPVEIEGRLLADGGISQNVPVRVAQAMGAQVIIAVDVATPPDPLENLTTALSISQQVMRFPIQHATREDLAVLGPEDVLIVPELSGVRSTDFGQLAAALESGLDATRALADRLQWLSLDPSAYRAWRQRIRTQRTPPPRVASVRIHNPSRLSDTQIRDMVHQSVGDLLDMARLREDLARIHGLGFFESVSYRVTPERSADGARQPDSADLTVRLVPQPWGPNRLRFGLVFADNLAGSSGFAFRAGLTLTQLNGWGGEWRNRIELGRVRRLSSEWYQPFGGGGIVFFAPHAEYRRDLLETYDGSALLAPQRRAVWLGGVDVGLRLGNWGEVRVGAQRGTVDLAVRTDPQDSVGLGANLGGATLRLAIDRLDDRRFPQRGLSVNAEVVRSSPRLGAGLAYTRLFGEGLRAFGIGATTVLLGAEVGSSLGDALPPWDNFDLGGQFRLSGLRSRESTGSNLALGSLAVYHPLAVLPTALAGGRLFVGGSVEVGDTWDASIGQDPFDPRVSASVFAGLETFLGPILLGYGRVDGGSSSWTFTLGRTF